MPKPIPLTAKQQWLQEYQEGKSEFTISKKYHRDVRTIRKGIEDVIHDQEIHQARVNFLTERLNRHQDSLLNELKTIKESTKTPEMGYAPLSWNDDENSVFSYVIPREQVNPPVDTVKKKREKGNSAMTARSLIEEHLGSDMLIKSLRSYEVAYENNFKNRKALQKTILNTLGKVTKLKVADKNIKAPYVCSYTTGDFLYQKLIHSAASGGNGDEFCREIKADVENGNVTYRRNTLIEAPGMEELYRKRLCRTFVELQHSIELIRVINTQKALEAAVTQLHQAIEEVLLLGMVTGKCRVCRRLGM